jgi:hypothetical protein
LTHRGLENTVGARSISTFWLRRAKQLTRRVRRDLGLDVSAFELARWLREDPRFVREAVAPNNAYWRLQLNEGGTRPWEETRNNGRSRRS